MEALKWSTVLAKAAREHCKDLGRSGKTGHIGSNGSTPQQRIENYGEWTGKVGENIAYGDWTGK